MKTLTYQSSITLGGVDLRIYTKPHSGCYVEILKACKGQMDAMLSHSSRLFVFRFDLRLRRSSGDNKVMSDFMRATRKVVVREYAVKRMAYIWSREQHDAETQHYHAALMLDGHKIRHSSKLSRLLFKTAASMDASIGYCPRPYYNLNRSDLAKYEDCFFRLSYIAKERGKGVRKKTANDFSSSRIKPPDTPTWGGFKENVQSLGAGAANAA